jgi:TonB family protein
MKSGFFCGILFVASLGPSAGFGQGSDQQTKWRESFSICDYSPTMSAPCAARPDLIHFVMPQYSKEQWPNVGSVILSMEIDTTGVPRDIRVVKSMGEGLDEPAIAAVTQWRYKPATHMGEPVPVKTKLELRMYCGGAPVTYSRSINESVQTPSGPKRLNDRRDCAVNYSCEPVLVYRVEPKYSKEMFSDDVLGSIVLSLVLDEHGNARDVHVVKSLRKEMDEIAIAAVKQWRYRPALYKGQPLPANVRVEIDVSSCDIRWELLR